MIETIKVNNTKKRHAFLTFVFFILGLNLFGATYYVSTSGSNSNSGTTAGSPFLTIQYAMNTASSGDVIVIASGTYNLAVTASKSVTFDIEGQSVTIKSLRMKTAGADISISATTAGGELFISDSLDLTTGLVKITGTAAADLKLLPGCKLLGGNKNSYVDGGFWIGSTNNTAMNYPVGSGSDYRPITVNFSKTGTSVEYYFAKVIAGSPSFSVALPTTTRNISSVHHHYLTTTASTSVASNFVIKFSYDSVTNDDHVYDIANLQLLTSTGSAAWTINNTGGTANRLGTITSTAITNLTGYYILGNKLGSSTLLGGTNALGSKEPFAAFQTINQCDGDTITFYSTSKSVGSLISTYTWDFGDGSSPVTTSVPMVKYKYNSSPLRTPATTLPSYNFTVSLTISNGNSTGTNNDIGNKLLVIYNSPTYPEQNNIFTQVAYVLPVKQTVCDGQPTLIKDKYPFIAGESITKKVWKITPTTPAFVKGSSAAETGGPIAKYKDSSSITFKFPTAQSYKIFITRTTSYGCVSIDSTDYVQHPRPTVAISMNDQCWEQGKNVVITNGTAEPSPDKMNTWRWDLGDGTKYSGKASPLQYKTVFHAFAMAGAYPIKLAVTSDIGCSDSQTVILNLYPKPVAQFGVTKTCIGEVTNTLNSSYVPSPGSTAYYIWKYGDGSPSDSAFPNASHTYAKIGVYKMTLEVQSDKGCIDTQAVWFRVHPKPTPKYAVKEACFGDVTKFRRLIDKYPRQDSMFWNWSFDDSIKRTDTAEILTFTTPGIHKVSLIGTSKAGCQDSTSGVFQVFYKPSPSFGLDVLAVPNDSIQCEKWNKFTMNMNYGIDPMDTLQDTRFHWGDTSVQMPIVTNFHSYDTFGVYTQKLFVSNIHGCADSVTHQYVVVPSPTAGFGYDGLCMPDSVQFTDTFTVSQTSIVNRYWDFGNGTYDTTKTSTKSYYTNSGPFTASLIVETTNGCSDTMVKSINTLIDKPTVNWILSGSMPLCKGDSATFTVTGGDSIIWLADNDSIWSKPFSKTGSYKFLVYNKGNCPVLDSVQVYAYPPANIKAHSDTAIFRGRRAEVYVSNALKDFKWYPGKYVVDSTATFTKTIQLTDSITLFVTATDSNGCTDMDSIHINVIDPPLVKIPNLITPNGDKYNEYWDLIEIPDVFLFDIIISDRQGKRVYESNNYQNDWNGKDSEGNILPNGVYFYYMKNRQTSDVYRGYIQVIR